MSGGRATVRGKSGKNTNSQLGDISMVASEGKWLIDNFVIEAKFYADLDIHAFLFAGRGKLDQFWREVSKIAAREDRSPMLIAKQNRMQPMLITTMEGIERIGPDMRRRIVVHSRYARPPAFLCWLSGLKGVPCPLS